jgi:Uma2 family endonuclease
MSTQDILTAPPDQMAEPTWDIARLFPCQGAWSETEYLALDTNHLVEYSHGIVEVLTMPSDKHQSILGYLYTVFLAFAVKTGGKVLFSPLCLRLWPGKIREPDMLFLASASDARRQSQVWTGADLVVEVVSPDDPARDLITKRQEYAQAGIAEYWIVDPRSDTVLVLHLQGTAYVERRYARGDVARSATFPALAVDVSATLDAA